MRPSNSYDIVIIGGGAAGIATAASILKRRPDLEVAIVEPKEEHYYQPGWTMVGAGVFEQSTTRRRTADLIPQRAHWLRQAVATFEPDANQVTLEDETKLRYQVLVVAPGLELAWGQVEGLEAALGANGVTSNYRYELAPYTWKTVQELAGGRAIFTQPPMPIKCAGAPQKAMYLSCDHWLARGVLSEVDVEFHNAGGVLFGVEAYVPALMKYVERYGINLKFVSKLVAVDGPSRQAVFETAEGQETRDFDMLHVLPPQVAPQFVRESPLAGPGGFVEVDDSTLRHKRYPDIFALGDAGSMPNAKTAAAARKQAPVVAVNVLAALDGKEPLASYDGYGSCPLTVERGKVVLAEFGYGGKLLPSFPSWLVDGTRPQRLSWLLKSEALPWLYWNGMLKGNEWLAGPQLRQAS